MFCSVILQLWRLTSLLATGRQWNVMRITGSPSLSEGNHVTVAEIQLTKQINKLLHIFLLTPENPSFV